MNPLEYGFEDTVLLSNDLHGNRYGLLLNIKCKSGTDQKKVLSTY